MILSRWDGSLLCSATRLDSDHPRKPPLPSKITKQTIHQLPTDDIYGQFQSASLLSRVGGW